jgi:hypothetical protein
MHLDGGRLCLISMVSKSMLQSRRMPGVRTCVCRPPKGAAPRLAVTGRALLLDVTLALHGRAAREPTGSARGAGGGPARPPPPAPPPGDAPGRYRRCLVPPCVVESVFVAPYPSGLSVRGPRSRAHIWGLRTQSTADMADGAALRDCAAVGMRTCLNSCMGNCGAFICHRRMWGRMPGGRRGESWGVGRGLEGWARHRCRPHSEHLSEGHWG